MKRFKKLLAILCAVGCMSSYSAMTVFADNEQEPFQEGDTSTVTGAQTTENDRTFYNDPVFSIQDHLFDCNIIPVHKRRVSNEKVKVAVFDSEFGSLNYDVNFKVIGQKPPLYEKPAGYHGAYVSSVIGNIPNNGIGAVGVANNVEIIPLQCIGFGVDGYSTKEALRICEENDIKILVSSSTIICDQESLKQFAAEGGIIVNSAGNVPFTKAMDIDGYYRLGPDDDYSPIEYEWDEALKQIKAVSRNLDVLPMSVVDDNSFVRLYSDDNVNYNIMVVTGVDSHGDLAGTVCYGKTKVTVAAPFTAICDGEKGLQFVSGTSFACPIAGGVVALLQSYFPSATTRQIRQAIINSAFYNEKLADKCQAQGTLNAYGAMIDLEKTLMSQKYSIDESKVITDGEYYILNADTGSFLSFDKALAGTDSRANLTTKCGDAQKFKIEITKNLEYVIMPVDGKDDCFYYNEERNHAYIGDFGETGNHAWKIEYAGKAGNDDIYHLNSYKDTDATNSLYEISGLLNVMPKGSTSYKTANKNWIFVPASKINEYTPVYSDRMDPHWFAENDDNVNPNLPANQIPDESIYEGEYYIQNVVTGEYISMPFYKAEGDDGDTSMTPLYGVNYTHCQFKLNKLGYYASIEWVKHKDAVLAIYALKTGLKSRISQYKKGADYFNSTRWLVIDNGDGTYSFQSKMWKPAYLAANDMNDSYGSVNNTDKLISLYAGEEIPDIAKWRLIPVEEIDIQTLPAMPPLPHTLKPSDQKDINPVTPVPVPTTTPAPAAAPAPTTPTKEPAPTPVPTPSFDLPLEEGTYYITNSSDGTRLSCELGSQDVRLWDPDDYFVQQWQVTLNSNGNYVIKPVGTNWVLNYRARFRNGDIVDCTNPTAGAKGQEFVIVPRSDGTFDIQASFNANFTMVYDGLDVMFLDCTGQTNPMNSWIFTKVN